MQKDVDIEIVGLSIEVNGYQFPESTDFWDANWVDVTAICEANGAKVIAKGPIIHLQELSEFAKQIDNMSRGDAQIARLRRVEETAYRSCVSRGPFA